MIRRKLFRGKGSNPSPQSATLRSDSSRLSPLVLDNPVNQAAHWSQESYQLQDLVSSFQLPQMVRCSSKLLPGEDINLPFNPYVPMLLCPGRSAQKVLAKHVGRTARQPYLTETNDTIVIPSDYIGHFLRLQARTTKDKTGIRSLQFIARHPVPAFVNLSPVTSFTCGQSDQSNFRGSNNQLDSDHSDVSGSHASSKADRKSTPVIIPQKRVLHPPGTVFMVSGTTKGVNKTKRRSRDVPLLRCSSEDGTEWYIPCDQEGEFLEVETPKNGSLKLSVLPEDLLTDPRYPRLVRYVYGPNPPRLSPCTKLFTVLDSFQEDSLIVCLLYPGRAQLMEVPLTSSLTFQVATNQTELLSQPLPRHALEVVRARKETFLQDLKLKVKFVHQVGSGLGQAVGFMSDTGDEDMQSVTVRARQYVSEAFFYV